MIDKREILESASALGLLPHVVEKDYVLGWLLAGIHRHPELTDAWVFKGGTCLKKCYFETYRFSEDLDFTLRDEAGLDESLLRRVLGEVVTWVADESGLVYHALAIVVLYQSIHLYLTVQVPIFLNILLLILSFYYQITLFLS